MKIDLGIKESKRTAN